MYASYGACCKYCNVFRRSAGQHQQVIRQLGTTARNTHFTRAEQCFVRGWSAVLWDNDEVCNKSRGPGGISHSLRTCGPGNRSWPAMNGAGRHTPLSSPATTQQRTEIV